uniref:Nuclear receptor-interacting protein 2 n=1 Tax=Ursus maritimus TaxID=29073 RepID=A0A452UGP5_URSMA
MSWGLEARREEGDSRRRGQEAALGDRGPLSQQRRLRQATQFLHKDSADLLPLDSLKRLGTSKDLQPHSVIQRRLVEGSQSRLQGESPLVQALVCGQESRRTSKTEIPALLVNCKVRGPPGHQLFFFMNSPACDWLTSATLLSPPGGEGRREGEKISLP